MAFQNDFLDFNDFSRLAYDKEFLIPISLRKHCLIFALEARYTRFSSTLSSKIDSPYRVIS